MSTQFESLIDGMISAINGEGCKALTFAIMDHLDSHQRDAAIEDEDEDADQQ